MKKKIPKPRLPIANKPNVTHKDKSKYDRKEEKQRALDEIVEESERLDLYEEDDNE